MRGHDRLRLEIETLQLRLARLTEAILRISEDLDLDVVLQEVADSARSLTDARYGAVATLDDAGELEDLVVSGLTPEDRAELMRFPEGKAFFKYLSELEQPIRTSDFVTDAAAAGFPGFKPPIRAFLGTEILARDTRVGMIFIGEKENGQEFTREDETTLEMFAAQSATAVTNARRYGDEQHAKADLEALINTSPVGVLVIDAKSRQMTRVNREAHRILGTPPGREADLVRHVRQLTFRRMDSTEIPLHELPIARALLRGETTWAQELVVCPPDGAEVTTLMNATPIHADDGELVSVVATVQDITPLAELERLRAEFLGMVSHELRAPLTSIKGSAATVLGTTGPLDPAETYQFFRIIEEQADHMRDLISNLLDVTRIEAGTLSVAPEPADLAALIDQATNAFASGGHRANIKADLPTGLPLVWADRKRLMQVLFNLLTNANNYSRDWSTITVSASPQDLHVAVSVTDQGAGITADQLPRLFTKFARAETGNGDKQPDGYGLGLAICKGIVEAHGGRIWARSDGPGRGTTFTFTVPAVDEASANLAARDGPAGSERAPTKAELILALDDDPQTLRYLHRTLTQAGYAPILTGDPDELPRLLEARTPHLVLLNLTLPGTDGFELMRRIPKMMEAPVIILSGRGSDHYVSRAFEMGATDYVVKPFSPSELLARITAALRRREMSQQSEPYRLGDLTVDYLARTVTVAGRPARLTPTEYKLLTALCTNSGQVLTYDQLLERVWGEGSLGGAQRVRTFVKNLRRKLGDDATNPTYIVTVPGIGYRAATA